MEELNIKEMFNYFLSKIKLMLILTLIITLVGSSYFLFIKKGEYEVSATLFATRINNLDSDKKETDNTPIIPTYMELIKARPILNSAIEDLNLNYSFKQLLNMITTEQVSNTDILKIKVKSEVSSEEALKIADYISNKFKEQNNATSNIATLSVLEKAELLSEPSKLDEVKNIVLIFIVGIILSLMIVFIMYYFDNTVKSKEEIEDLLNLKLLAFLPDVEFYERVIAHMRPNSNMAERFKEIKNMLSKDNEDLTTKSILVTGPSRMEGKSFVASNLAITYAKANKKVLLIDGNMREGRTNLLFNLENKNGLSEVLDNKLKLKDAIFKSEIPNLDFLNCGTFNTRSNELITLNFSKILEEAKKMYDLVVIVSAPGAIISDGIVMSKYTDKSILVAQHRKTDLDELKNVKKELEYQGSDIVGVVINKYVPLKEKEYKDYYIE